MRINWLDLVLDSDKEVAIGTRKDCPNMFFVEYLDLDEDHKTLIFTFRTIKGWIEFKNGMLQHSLHDIVTENGSLSKPILVKPLIEQNLKTTVNTDVYNIVRAIVNNELIKMLKTTYSTDVYSVNLLQEFLDSIIDKYKDLTTPPDKSEVCAIKSQNVEEMRVWKE